MDRIHDKKIWKTYFLITGFVWITILSFFWSEDKHTFIKELRPTLSLFIFPFVILFFFPKISKINKEKIYFSFIVCMFIYAFMWFNYHVEGISIYQEKELHEVPISESSLLDKLSYFKKKTYRGWVSGIANRGHLLDNNNSFFKHHTYISVFLNLAILFCVFLLKGTINRKIKICCLLLLPFFISFLVYLSSVVNIAFLAFVFVFAVFHLIQSRRMKVFVLICSFGLGIFIAKDKIARLYKDIDKWSLVSKRYRNYDGRQVIDYLRYTIMLCSKEQIMETPLIGIGLGDYQTYLSQCLKEKDTRNKLDHRQEYNSHSQYLHYFLVGGIANGVFFLVFLGFFISRAIKTKDLLFMSFLLLIIFNLGFENFLNRIWGVLFIIVFLMIIPVWKEIPLASNND